MVLGLGFMLQRLGFRVCGLGFGFGVSDLGFKVQVEGRRSAARPGTVAAPAEWVPR